ncbi:sugar ABC transporter permease YjfF [Phototrophicus methaneseepsis]|uniref:Sugar ABC transporter permease YjfF n=1 Tax=Phototrophicus methaneseepsis TaxID=2710758 RepID=A0A7S8EBD7_9CHLR|nr:galactofuranose ABC transporter, permease protein YjfF [Phototrophicus methaneseepsis]QPC83855.1 sugar ABC transporter permease YjfF [Phototrophicus methaneseepsis]
MKSRIFPLIATIVVFVLLYLIGWQRFPAFGTTRVILNILTDKAFLGVAAVGMTFVILSGGIDLSVGSVIAFTSIFCALLIQNSGFHPLAAFAVALLLGAAFGATMGAIIHYLKIPPFIVTLAGMFLARGASFLLSEASVAIEHPFYADISSMYYLFEDKGRLTFVATLFVVILLLGMIVAHFTRFGRNVYALGGDSDSALLLGVPIARTTIGVYTLSSILATLAGIIYSLYTRSGYPLAAVGLELDAIAAVVVGGTLLTGGVGYVMGTFVGVLIQGVIQTYINFDGGLNSWWTKIVIGALLFVFIVLQKILSSRTNIFQLRRDET